MNQARREGLRELAGRIGHILTMKKSQDLGVEATPGHNGKGLAALARYIGHEVTCLWLRKAKIVVLRLHQGVSITTEAVCQAAGCEPWDGDCVHSRKNGLTTRKRAQREGS